MKKKDVTIEDMVDSYNNAFFNSNGKDIKARAQAVCYKDFADSVYNCLENLKTNKLSHNKLVNKARRAISRKKEDSKDITA